MSDAELLQAWRAGDREAGNTLIRRHFESICRFFRCKLGDDVEDLVQRTFLDCVQSHERVDQSGFRAYLFAVAKHRLYDHLRAQYRRPEQLDLAVITVEDLGTSPSQRVARTEQEQLLVAALRLVPVEYQIALELAYWEGLSAPEIATVLGIPANTVRGRLARARAALREHVERLAGAPELGASTLDSLDTRVAASLD